MLFSSFVRPILFNVVSCRFTSSAPLSSLPPGPSRPTLSHQRVQPDQEKHYDPLTKQVKRGLKKVGMVRQSSFPKTHAPSPPQGPKATRYRKGACANCGAMTHKRVDCLERPRKLGAQYTGKNIAADEHLPVQ